MKKTNLTPTQLDPDAKINKKFKRQQKKTPNPTSSTRSKIQPVILSWTKIHHEHDGFHLLIMQHKIIKYYCSK